MTTTTTTAKNLIKQSTDTGTIVTAPYDMSLAMDLIVECADSHDEDGVASEYWGSLDGREWRVRLVAEHAPRGWESAVA